VVVDDDEVRGTAPGQPLYTEPLPGGGSADFVIVNNYSILTPVAKEGAIDFRNIRNGEIQARRVLGKFLIGRMKLSPDRKWLALEQHPVPNPVGVGIPAETFDVGVYAW